MKMHLNFATSDLGRSIEFYSTLLDARPNKTFSDYALFVTERPALELALAAAAAVEPPGDAHYGIVVETLDEVDRAAGRLAKAGLIEAIEREQTCCYANQSKVWTIDPEKRRWEIYVVHEETEERGSAGESCCGGRDEASNACCAG
ncbi:MAG TPA: ArsI/CadI family heavy metal resistance metalloenzyme [Candidatus Baltobacteraceae bacterium]|jgi:catechol 2,3-dioxygenase-like lactoylglutathione lyase family enzyme|nr:ArsI/CadI family heavy metal resistance metalloenzyme [Candidatus Baltobacteraceae bacterium]